MNSDVAGKTLDADNEDHFMRFAGALGWDTRDSWRDPRRGWLNEIEVWRTTGDGSFWTANVDVRRYQPTGARQHLLLSGLLTLQSGTVGQDVPGYMTYYLGGANSVRGYNVEELGPVVHGKNQAPDHHRVQRPPAGAEAAGLLAMVVQRRPAARGSSATSGLAWSTPEEFAWDRFRGGGGAGLRILVPGAEQVRLDVGWSADGGVHFHFASGTKPAGQRRRPR